MTSSWSGEIRVSERCEYFCFLGRPLLHLMQCGLSLLKVYNTETWEILESTHYSGNGKAIETLAVSPDDQLLAAGGDDGNLNIFKVCHF